MLPAWHLLPLPAAACQHTAAEPGSESILIPMLSGLSWSDGKEGRALNVFRRRPPPLGEPQFALVASVIRAVAPGLSW